MARLSIAAAGNAAENINLINPRFNAEALRRLRGYDVGILDNSFFTDSSPKGLDRVANNEFMWKLTASNVLDIAVGRGMATAYGYDLQSEATVHLTGTAPSAGVKYLFVYLEWNLSNPVEAIGKIDIHDNGLGTEWTPPRQDNLILNPIGVYQLPLYKICVNTAGVVTGYSSCGAKVIGGPLLAENARHAEKATDAETLAGEAVSRSGGTLYAGDGKAIMRRKTVFSGSWMLYNATSFDATTTLSEALTSGDLLMVEYITQAYLESEPTQVVFVKVGPVHGGSFTGFTLTSVTGSFSGPDDVGSITISADTFLVSGTTLKYKSGYYMLNIVNEDAPGPAALKNNAICIKKIYKIYA